VRDSLINEVAWAKTCLLITAATVPGSPERAHELTLLRQAVIGPRRAVDKILDAGQAVPREVIVALRVCELAIPKLEAGEVLRQSIVTRGSR
jgi:hypothetical protein